MQRPSPAARRFYRAFYQWNVVSHTPRRIPHSSRAQLHSSTRLHDEDTVQVKSEPSPTRRTHRHRLISKHLSGYVRPRSVISASKGNHGKSQSTNQKAADQRLSPNPDSIPQKWTSGPVETVTERPFTALGTDESAVRFRSESGLLIEQATCGDVLAKAQQKHGRDLKKLAERFGARIEVQDISRQREGAPDREPHNMLHSILISGAFEEVQKVHNFLRESNRTAIPALFKTAPVQSSPEKPLALVRPGHYVIRFRSDRDIIVEYRLSSGLLEKLQNNYGSSLEKLAERSSSRIEIHSPPGGRNSTENGAAHDNSRSVIISGTHAEVAGVVNPIASLVALDTVRGHGRTTQQDEQRESNDIEIKTGNTSHTSKQARPDAPDKIAKQWLLDPVQDATSRSSASLSSLESVIRSRSATDITIETALPINRFRVLQSALGPQLEALAYRFGVQVVLQYATARLRTSDMKSGTGFEQNARLTSVLITGSLLAVARAQWACQSYIDPGVQLKVHSTEEVPSNHRRVVDGVTRSSSESGQTMELSVDSSNWQRMQADGVIPRLVNALGVSLKIGEAHERQYLGGKSVPAVSIYLTGPNPAVRTLRRVFVDDYLETTKQAKVDDPLTATAERWPESRGQQSRSGTVQESSLRSASNVDEPKCLLQDPSVAFMYVPPPGDFRARIQMDGAKLIKKVLGTNLEELAQIRMHSRCTEVFMKRLQSSSCCELVIEGTRQSVAAAIGSLHQKKTILGIPGQDMTIIEQGTATAERPGALRKAILFSSLVRLPSHDLEKLRPPTEPPLFLVSERFANETRCFISFPVDGDRDYHLIQGPRSLVENAKKELQRRFIDTCRFYRVPAVAMNVLYESDEWFPSKDECAVLAKTYTSAKGSIEDAVSPVKQANVEVTTVDTANGKSSTPEPHTERQTSVPPDQGLAKDFSQQCSGTIFVTGPGSTALVRLISQDTDIIKRKTGCHAVLISKNRLIGTGSEQSVERFIDDMRLRIREASGKLGLQGPQTRELVQSPSAYSDVDLNAEESGLHDVQGEMDPEEAAQLGEDVRIALRALAHPVVLITSRSTREDESVDQITPCRGVTVSSFNTVTLQPQPVVSFNIKVPSRSWDAIKASGRMRIHLLAASPRGAAIADAFTKPHKQPFGGFLALGNMGVKVYTFKGNVPPRVFQKDAVLAQMHANLLLDRCVRVGDHYIVVARVESCKFADETGLKTAAEMGKNFTNKMQGLAYAKQGYKNAGEKVEVSRTRYYKHESNEKEPRKQTSAKTRRAKTDERQNGKDGLPGNLPDPLAVGVGMETAGLQGHVKTGDTQHEGSRMYVPEPVGDPIYDTLRATRDSSDSGEEVDFSKLLDEEEEDEDIFRRAMSGGDEDMDAAAREEEEEYDLGFEPPSSGMMRRQQPTEPPTEGEPGSDADSGRRTAAPEQDQARARSEDVNALNTEHPVPTGNANAHSPLWGPEDMAREDSLRLGARSRPRELSEDKPATADQDAASETRLGGNQDPPRTGTLDTSGKRPYSTYARLNAAPLSSRRHFSSSAATNQAKPSSDKNDWTQHVIPEARQTTVSDYLGFPDDGLFKPHAIRGAITMRAKATGYGKMLRAKDDILTDEEKETLQRKITTFDRITTKKVAWNACYHLGLMLDKGRVDFKRARFLESAIEKGQAVILEEAKMAREALEKGRIDLEQYRGIREGLQEHEQRYRTELGRLGQVVEEEVDGFQGGGADEAGKGSGFDGFQGNR